VLSRSAQLVLDADALNAIAQDSALQTLLARRASAGLTTVLTPHPLEAARLLGCTVEQLQMDRLAAAQELAQRWSCVVVLKGSGTVIAAPNEKRRSTPQATHDWPVPVRVMCLLAWWAQPWRAGWQPHPPRTWRCFNMDRGPTAGQTTRHSPPRHWPKPFVCDAVCSANRDDAQPRPAKGILVAMMV
jgi:hypothetical protein